MAGKNPIQGALDGISNFFGGIWHGLTDFASDVWNKGGLKEATAQATATVITDKARQFLAGSKDESKQDNATKNGGNPPNDNGIPIWLIIGGAVALLLILFLFIFKK